jgi:hypothetical protein
MVKMGFKTIHTRSGNFFEVYQIPADQIQSSLAIPEDDMCEKHMKEGDLTF